MHAWLRDHFLPRDGTSLKVVASILGLTWAVDDARRCRIPRSRSTSPAVPAGAVAVEWLAVQRVRGRRPGRDQGRPTACLPAEPRANQSQLAVTLEEGDPTGQFRHCAAVTEPSSLAVPWSVTISNRPGVKVPSAVPVRLRSPSLPLARNPVAQNGPASTERPRWQVRFR